MNDTEVCGRCGNQRLDTKGQCPGCGAYDWKRVSDLTKPVYERDRGEPFIYNGCIVYAIRDFSRDTYEFHFYAGMTLLEVIAFSAPLFRELRDQIDANTDMMSTIWQMFEVAHGKRDMGIIEANSKKAPALITFTRMEYPRELLTWEHVVEEYKLNPDQVIRFKPIGDL